MSTHTVFGHCKHCMKEIIYPHNKPKIFCSIECYRGFEKENTRAKHGFMADLIARQRKGQTWKETTRNVYTM